MKVYKFKCKDCGSKSYEKIDDHTYKCLYCGNIEEVIVDKKEEDKKQASEMVEQPTQQPVQPVVIETKQSEEKTTDKKEKDTYKPELNFTSVLIDFLICFFFGVFGVHKFKDGNFFMGIVYLFTIGLFGIGYFIDCLVRFVGLIKAFFGLLKGKA